MMRFPLISNRFKYSSKFYSKGASVKFEINNEETSFDKIVGKLTMTDTDCNIPMPGRTACNYDNSFRIVYNVDGVAKYKEVIDNSQTIFINGTAGMYEDKKFATGTRELLEYIANSKLVKIVGGGDGVSAVKYFHFEDKFDFLSTGGGATLEYIINEGLPAINNIQEQ